MERNLGIIAPWCNYVAVLSALITRAGLWGAANTLQPAASMFPCVIVADTQGKSKTLLEILGKPHAPQAPE